MLHAIIMAGGSGTRFWPASRHSKPKQLLSLAGERTMIQATVDRLAQVMPAERIRVLTAGHLTEAISQQLPELPADNIVGEPCRRDTAPCVGLASALVSHDDDDATMLVCPADHVILQHERFAEAVRRGCAILDEHPDAIVTFGVLPSYPAESFGYIQRGESLSGHDAFEVEAFKEKPDAETAKAYLGAGTYFWNAGIFLWRAETITKSLAEHEPEMSSHLSEIEKAIGSPNYPQVLAEQFAAIEGKSIDYAVMERHQQVIVIEAPFDWDDVGSWQAVSRLHKPDEHGNSVVGNHLGIDSTDCIIHGDADHTIVTIDAHDLIVVQTEDATLVAPKSSEERVREVVAELKQQNRNDLI